MHVKKGDKVLVIAGKEKGKTGVITQILLEENRVVIDGLNMMKRSTRPRKAGEKGGIISIAAPIHASNVKLSEKAAKAPAKKKTAKKAE